MQTRVRHRHSAAVFVTLIENSSVCMLRRQNTGWLDGAFSLPAGGLEAGETIAAAAAREAREEIGVTIDLENLNLVHTLHCFSDDGGWVGYFFTASRWSGRPVLCEPDKHSDLAWFPVQAPPDETVPYVAQALRCIQRLQTYSEFGWK